MDITELRQNGNNLCPIKKYSCLEPKQFSHSWNKSAPRLLFSRL